MLACSRRVTADLGSVQAQRAAWGGLAGGGVASFPKTRRGGRTGIEIEIGIGIGIGIGIEVTRPSDTKSLRLNSESLSIAIALSIAISIPMKPFSTDALV